MATGPIGGILIGLLAFVFLINMATYNKNKRFWAKYAMPMYASIAILSFLIHNYSEYFVDTEFKVDEPTMRSATWRSKIFAHASIGADDKAYIDAISKFYTEVYVPAPVKPTKAKLEEFLKSYQPAPGVDKDVLRKILFQGFHVELGETAAANEQKQIKFQPTKSLFPENGVDEVRTRKENDYRPVDTQIGELPEGQYAPISQSYPINEGVAIDKDRPSFSSVP
jgi:hypothetical protein